MGVRHEACTFVLPDVGHREVYPLWVSHLGPGLHASLLQPVVELAQRSQTPLGGLAPDVLAPILNVLLDDALLPTGGPVAELRLEHLVPGHRLEARIDTALLALATRVRHQTLQVIDLLEVAV